MNTKPISETARGTGCTRAFLALFGLTFLVAGCVAFWFLFVLPISNILQARSWTSVECSIVSSTVAESRDSEGDTTYAPEIKYSYAVNGQSYQSDRYSFLDVSSGRNWAQSIVDQFPPGSQQVCFYNPEDADKAVLMRDFSWGNLLGLLTLLFVLVGAGVLGYALLGKMPTRSVTGSISESAGSRPRSGDDDLVEEDEGPRKLRPETSRVGRLIAVGIGCLIWNGFLAVVMGIMWADGQTPFQGDICFWLFMIPFVLVGIALVIGFLHQLLSLWNPTVEIGLSRGAVPLGQSVDIAWQLEGRVSRIRRLTIEILGEEKATYTSGTNTYTDTETFLTIEVANTTASTEMEFGNQTITIPANTMHSFDGGNNKVVWSITVRGDIPLWPDVSESFPFRIKPMEVADDSN